MSRQAEQVRQHLGGRRRKKVGPASVIAVASGRGGAGVSLVSAALALRSAAAGMSTLLVDADPWLDVQRIWLGVSRGPSLETLQGGMDPESLVVEVAGRLELVSFGAGRPVERDVRALTRRVPGTFATRDVVVVDCGSGLDALERALDLHVGSLLLVTGADPVGLAATHALMKASWGASHMEPQVLFNRVGPDQAAAGQTVLAEGGRRYLGFQPPMAGTLPTDAELSRALSDGAHLPESLAGSDLVRHVDRIMPHLLPWRRTRHDG